MHQPSLILADPWDHSRKAVGPIVLALAFVLAVGGIAAAAILVCGWHNIKSVGVNVIQRHVEIVCR